MRMEQIIERGFSFNHLGVILDEHGNEYRDEGGQVEVIGEADNEELSPNYLYQEPMGSGVFEVCVKGN